MGYMVHHAIVVTSWDESSEGITAAHREAESAMPGLVSPIVKSWTNDYRSFLVAPDGSKQGWATDEQGEKGRERFIDWLRSQEYSDGSSRFSWALVQYGDDNEDNRVVEASR